MRLSIDHYFDLKLGKDNIDNCGRWSFDLFFCWPFQILQLPAQQLTIQNLQAPNVISSNLQFPGQMKKGPHGLCLYYSEWKWKPSMKHLWIEHDRKEREKKSSQKFWEVPLMRLSKNQDLEKRKRHKRKCFIE